MADNEGTKTVLTVRSIKGQPWQKPDSDQLWHSVVAEEKPGEPITFIQDTSKDAPAPEFGKKYSGKVYPNPKGPRFYADGAKYQNVGGEAPSASESAKRQFEHTTKPNQSVDWDDRQLDINAQWAIREANILLVNGFVPVKSDGVAPIGEIESVGLELLNMKERIKASFRGQSTETAGEFLSESGLDVLSDEDLAENQTKRPDLSEIPF